MSPNDARSDATQQGVREAFTGWLRNCPPFYVRDVIEDAVKAATKEWLDQHGHDLLTRKD